MSIDINCIFIYHQHIVRKLLFILKVRFINRRENIYLSWVDFRISKVDLLKNFSRHTVLSISSYFGFPDL